MLPTRHLNDHEKTTDEETCWYSGSVIEPGQQTQIRSEVDYYSYIFDFCDFFKLSTI